MANCKTFESSMSRSKGWPVEFSTSQIYGHIGDDAAALHLGQRAHEDDHHFATKR